jgi:hypothetical protein
MCGWMKMGRLSVNRATRRSTEPYLGRTPGKKIGGCVYVHRAYWVWAIPADLMYAAEENMNGLPVGYVGIKWNKKNDYLTFQWSPDFNHSHEPKVGKCVLVKPSGGMVVREPSADPMVWHHKWLWVGDDYEGFDVEASKRRSKLYEDKLTARQKYRMGRLSRWRQILKELGLKP